MDSDYALINALLGGLGSMHILDLPLGLFSTTRLDTQSVGMSMQLIHDSNSSQSSQFSTLVSRHQVSFWLAAYLTWPGSSVLLITLHSCQFERALASPRPSVIVYSTFISRNLWNWRCWEDGCILNEGRRYCIRRVCQPCWKIRIDSVAFSENECCSGL